MVQVYHWSMYLRFYSVGHFARLGATLVAAPGVFVPAGVPAVIAACWCVPIAVPVNDGALCVWFEAAALVPDVPIFTAAVPDAVIEPTVPAGVPALIASCW